MTLIIVLSHIMMTLWPSLSAYWHLNKFCYDGTSKSRDLKQDNVAK